MYTSLEIEFKTAIDDDTYISLLKEFNLVDKVNKQTNFYFDTPDLKLIKNHIILRIREKDYNVKLTSKTPTGEGTLERHILLTKDEQNKMLKEGFDASVIEINEYVHNVAKLETYRAKTSYKSGTLFFDKNVYYDTVDYEIEFEVADEELGKKEFLEFLKEHNITYKKMVSKSKRAYKKSSQI